MNIITFFSASVMEQAGVLHSHDRRYEFHYMVSGKGSFINGDRSVPMVPGTIVWSAPRIQHQLNIEKGRLPAVFYLGSFIPGTSERRLIEVLSEKFGKAGCLNIGVNNRLYFEDIKRKFSSDNQCMTDSAVHGFLSLLYAIAGDDRMSLNAMDNRYVEKALQCMHERMYADIELGDLAHEIGLSTAYLIRLFKQKLGMPPHRYFLSMKMETASFLLLSSDDPVYLIADKLGFFDPFHFSKTFRQYVGVSPKTYRQRR